jgi:hypothetical protein
MIIKAKGLEGTGTRTEYRITILRQNRMMMLASTDDVRTKNGLTRLLEHYGA